MSETKEIIIMEDDSEDDDTEELYQFSVSFHQNRGNVCYCQVATFPSTNRNLTVS